MDDDSSIDSTATNNGHPLIPNQNRRKEEGEHYVSSCISNKEKRKGLSVDKSGREMRGRRKK